MDPVTLVILAAGMGSRFGGDKQLAEVGTDGAFLLDYSIYDARLAGFERFVFVVREEIKSAFETRYSGKEFAVAVQDVSHVPDEFLPTGRKKPWGTCHALLAAKDVVLGSMCVINADDFYGRESFYKMHRFLSSGDNSTTDFSMVGFRLGDTLSPNGGVSRGICEVNERGSLLRIQEHTNIETVNGVLRSSESDGMELQASTSVSMNMWGFSPRIFEFLEVGLGRFLSVYSDSDSREFLLPDFVNELLDTDAASVRVLGAACEWMGITYREDEPALRTFLSRLHDIGEYPTLLR